jgi:hypothetical protein
MQSIRVRPYTCDTNLESYNFIGSFNLEKCISSLCHQLLPLFRCCSLSHYTIFQDNRKSSRYPNRLPLEYKSRASMSAGLQDGQLKKKKTLQWNFLWRLYMFIQICYSVLQKYFSLEYANVLFPYMKYSKPSLIRCQIILIEIWKMNNAVHIWRVLDWMIGFIDTLYTSLGTTNNYNAIAISTLYSSLLHTLMSSVYYILC